MNRIGLTCFSALALMLSGTITAANATSYRPAGNTTFSGPVTATVGSTTLNCTITVTMNVPSAGADGHTTFSPSLASDPSHGHSATVTAFSLSGGFLNLCAAASLTGLPYTVSYSGPTVTINNVVATTFLGGNCRGNFTGTWNGTTLTIPTQTLNAAGSTMSCTFSGSATPNHAFSFDDTP